MGELKKEFDNATCPQSLALILSIYFASQIEFSIKKERYGRENPSCSNISSPFSFLHSLPAPVPVSISLPHYRITVGGFFKSIKIFFVLLFNIYRWDAAVCSSINVVYWYQCVASFCWSQHRVSCHERTGYCYGALYQEHGSHLTAPAYCSEYLGLFYYYQCTYIVFFIACWCPSNLWIFLS